MENVYVTIYRIENGVEKTTAPEKKGISVKEAIAFLQKYDEESTKGNS